MNIDIAEQIIATLHTRIDELVAERDEMRRKWLLGHELVTQFAQKSIAITAERDALAADAARYQWVQKQTRAFSLDMGGQHSWTVTGGFSRAKGPSLDEAIDAAIKAGV